MATALLVPATGIIAPVHSKYLELAHQFDLLTHFYGYAGSKDHNNRRCLDCMVLDTDGQYLKQKGFAKNLTPTQQKDLGDAVAAYAIANRTRLGVRLIIWNRRIWRNYDNGKGVPIRTWVKYTGPNPHTDHVHIEFSSDPYVPPVPGGPVVTPPKDLPTYYVDPKKVSTKLTANAPAGKKDLLRPPGFPITTALRIEGKWLITEAGYRYHIDYLTTTKPIIEPEPVDKFEFVFVGANVLKPSDAAENKRPPWTKRFPSIIRGLEAKNPDVIGLVEITVSSARQIFAAMGSDWEYQRFGPLALGWRKQKFDHRSNTEVTYRAGDGRRLFQVGLLHIDSKELIYFDISHLENDGDPMTDGHTVRWKSSAEWAEKSKRGRRVGFADFNSTTAPQDGKDARSKQKPRPQLAAVGWHSWVSQDANAENAGWASHHGGRGGHPRGPEIDDAMLQGDLKKVEAGWIRTDLYNPISGDHNYAWLRVQV